MPDHTVRPCMCPTCGYVMDRAGEIDGEPSRPPEPGDMSLCIECGDILQFDAGLQLGVAGEDVLAELARDQPDDLARIFAMQVHIRVLPREKPWTPPPSSRA